MLTLRLLGDIEVVRDGEALALPRSRKTRALLAYLVLAGRPQRRDRLCAMFWDVPDDPRGALRWSLSKLRQLIDEPDRPRIVADRETVAVDTEGMEIDILALRRQLAGDLDSLSAAALEEAADAFRGEFLEGLDLPQCHDFHAWCVAEREDARQSLGGVLRALIARLEKSPDDAVPVARRLAQLEPHQESAHAGLVRLLAAAGRPREALEQCEAGLRLLDGLGGGDADELRRLGQDLRSGADAAPPPGGAAGEAEGAGPPVSGSPPAPAPASADDRDPRPPLREGLALPDKPSIAVLPLDNLSGDPEQEYFADGIATDILTGLSRLRSLFVISRHSAFVYKGTHTAVERVARELGVRYVLEGSVRRAGERIRVTAQLVDASTRGHVWAERYDRDLEDIFAVQDEITEAIIAAIEPEVGSAERERALRRRPENLDAWGAFQRGLWHIYRFTPEDTAEALHLFRRSAEMDPSFARAYCGASFVHFSNAFLSYTKNRDAEITQAYENARRAIALDERDPHAHWVMGRAHMLRREHDLAIIGLERSIELNPSFAQGYYSLGWAQALARQPKATIENVETASRLSPYDPLTFAFMAVRSLALVLLGEYEEAADWAGRAARQPNAHFHIHAHSAAALGLLGRTEEARRAAAEVVRLRPDYTIQLFEPGFPFKHREDAEPFLKGLRAAGLPL